MSDLAYLQWHITHRCNNRCKHCYQIYYNGNEVSAQVARLIIDDFAGFCKILGVRPAIALTGGNPLMNSDFFAIFGMAKEICQDVGVLGNPEGLDVKTMRQLKSMGISYYQLSIDGLEKTHDAIRSAGSFQRTVHAMQSLRDAGIRVTAMSTVSALNFKEMEDVMRLAYSIGASGWYFSRHIPTQGDCGISAKDYAVFLKNIIEKHREFECMYGAMPLRHEPLISLVAHKEVDSLPKIKGGCGLGTASFALLPDNTIMACRRHPGSVLGKWTPEENFLKYFLFNPKMSGYRQIAEIEGCKSCKIIYYCRGCRAAAFAATGDGNGMDPQCFVDNMMQERR